MSNIVPFLPDPIFFLIAIGILGFIYYFLPSDIKDSVKKFLAKSWIYIIGFIFWLYFKGKWGLVSDDPSRWPANMSYASFIIGFLLLLYWGIKSWLYEMRYYTHHFVGDNISGSYTRVQEVGNVAEDDSWVVVFLGTSGSSDEKMIFPWPFPQKIAVFPKSTADFLGSQLVAKCQFAKVDILEMPEEVHNFIENDSFARWAKDDLWFGIFSTELNASDPKYQSLFNKIVSENSRKNELTTMLKGKLNIVKNFVTDTMAIQEKFKGKSWRQQPRQQENEE